MKTMFSKIIIIVLLNNFAYPFNFSSPEKYPITSDDEKIHLINRAMYKFDLDLKICKNFTDPCILPIKLREFY
jgi:hypothetical protein